MEVRPGCRLRAAVVLLFLRFAMNARFLIPLVVAGLSLVPYDAEACGGCIYGPSVADAGPSQNPSVVTDHRMVLSIDPEATTLWDQIEYAGDPNEFAWVLPIRGAVVVGLGSDAFIDALDKRTAPTIVPPTVRCKQPPPQNFGGGGGGGSSSMGCGCGSADDMESAAATTGGWSDTGIVDASPPDEGVVITERKAVGPYETVQIHGDDSESILGWLRRNKYVIPATIEPVLNKYIAEKFDFLAVRLQPGAGVHAMKPIRVSWRGATPMLPLRMVAAGVGESVGIKLFVVGDGRWKTKNFASYTIDDNDLVWDFVAQRSNYTKLRSDRAGLQDMHAFALETSDDYANYLFPGRDPGEPDAGLNMSDGAKEASDDASDAVSDDAAPAADAPAPYDAGDKPPVSDTADDVTVAFGKKSVRRITRLRADLPARHLNIDLELEADEDQGRVSTVRRVGKQTGAETQCPFGVESVSVSSTASPLTTDKAGSAACAVSARRSPLQLPALAIFGLFGLGVARVIRRRR